MNAYSDKAGLTRDFNMNLLTRINRELGGTFYHEKFNHVAVYNETQNQMESYLECTEDHHVDIAALDHVVSFKKGELIFTERSRKYSLSDIETLSIETGFHIQENYSDKKGYFVDSLFVNQE